MEESPGRGGATGPWDGHQSSESLVPEATGPRAVNRVEFEFYIGER
ncbi:MAG: hypothetical protein ACERKT_09235 [Acidobacteriota bacterium]